MKAKSMYIFSNGTFSIFGQEEEDATPLHLRTNIDDNWMVLLFSWLESQAIDVREMKAIEMNVNGIRTTVRPFKTDDGKWAYELIPYKK